MSLVAEALAFASTCPDRLACVTAGVLGAPRGGAQPGFPVAAGTALTAVIARRSGPGRHRAGR